VLGAHIEIILIVTGAATAIAAPAPVLRMIYGAVPKDALSMALARHWGLLISLIGALLIYAAFHPAIREPAITLAAIEKIALAVGILGTALHSHPVAAAIAVGDATIGLIYVLYLVGY
jgi:hypothetical protein